MHKNEYFERVCPTLLGEFYFLHKVLYLFVSRLLTTPLSAHSIDVDTLNIAMEIFQNPHPRGTLTPAPKPSQRIGVVCWNQFILIGV